MGFHATHKLTLGSIAVIAVFLGLSVYFSQVSFKASAVADKTASIVSGNVTGCYEDVEVGQDNIDCAVGGSSWCKSNRAIPGKCISGLSGDEAMPTGATGINCDTCAWIVAACSDANYTTNCRYSSCTRNGGTKTCDKNSDAPSTCTTSSRSWTTGIVCPTDCTTSSQTQTFDYQYTCTTDGKKTKVFTSSTGSCRPSESEIEECDVCNDTIGSSDAYTSCPWPQTCSSAQQGAGKAVVDCTVPSDARCKPTNSGSTTFSSTAKRSREKICCTIANDYTRICSQVVSSCPSSNVCSGGKIVEISSSLELPNYTAPSFRYSATKSSSRSCIALPSSALETSCCAVNVDSCTASQCKREGDGGTQHKSCKTYECKSDNTGFTDGTARDVPGASCTASCVNPGDYDTTQKVVKDQCPAGSAPGDGKYRKVGNKKKNGSNGSPLNCSPDWINVEDEKNASGTLKECCTTSKWSCPDPCTIDSNKGRTVNKDSTCTETICLEAPNAHAAKPVSGTVYCPDDSSSPPDTTLPQGTDGATLRFNGSSWSANRIIFNNGSVVGIGGGFGAVSPGVVPSATLELKTATTDPTRLRITDTSSNPELQLKNESGENKHWAFYVSNIAVEGFQGSERIVASDKSLRIWGFGQDRVIVDKDGNLHAKKFCSNMDMIGCTEVTGGGGEQLWTKVGTTNDISYSAGAVKIGNVNGLGIVGGNKYTYFKGASGQSDDIAYTLPATIAAKDGKFLKLGSSGALSWEDTGSPDLAQYHLNNLISNSGFEREGSEWEPNNLETTKNEHHSGYQGAVIHSSSGVSTLRPFNFLIKQNTPYSLSFWIKTVNFVSSRVPTLQVFSCKIGPPWCANEVKKIDLSTETSDWQKISITDIKVTNGDPELRIEFKFYHTAGEAYLDDVMFTESPTPLGYSAKFIEDSGNQSLYGRLKIGRLSSSGLSDNGATLSILGKTFSSGSTIISAAAGSNRVNFDGNPVGLVSGNFIYTQSSGIKNGRIIITSPSVEGNSSNQFTVNEPFPSEINNESYTIVEQSAEFASGGGGNPYINRGSGFSANGALGIGGTPSTMLHVFGGAKWGAALSIDASNVLKQNPENRDNYFNTTAGRRWDLISTGGDPAEGIKKFLIKDATANKVRLTIDENGNVGIGTTAPVSALHITGSTGLTLGEDKASGATNAAGTLKLISAGDNGFSTSFSTGTQSGDITYTLPLAQGTKEQILKIDAISGSTATLAWDDAKRGGGINMAMNPSFELSTVGYNLLPSSCYSFSVESANDAPYGGKIGKLVVNSIQGGCQGLESIGIQQDTYAFMAVPGKLFSGSAMVRAQSGKKITLILGAVNDSVNNNTSNKTTIIADGKWQKVSVKLDLRSLLASANRNLRIIATLDQSDRAVNDELFVDAVQIEEIGAPSSFNPFTVRGENVGGSAHQLLLFDGNVAIQKGYPNEALDVGGTIQATGFKLNIASKGVGKYLVSDAAGLATWADPPLPTTGLVAGDTLRYDGSTWIRNDFMFNSGSLIGIGTNAPKSRFEIKNGSYKAIQGPSGVTTSGTNVLGDQILTKFDTQIIPGDEVVIANEKRTVTRVRSSSLLEVATSFSNGISGEMQIIPSAIRIINASNEDLFIIRNSGRVGIGTTMPSTLLAIAGIAQNPTDGNCPAGTEFFDENSNSAKDNGECKSTITFDPDNGNLRITKNAGLGKVLVSDATGNATWQPPKFVPDGTAQGQTLWWDNTATAQKWIADNKLSITKEGNVGIGAVGADEFAVSRFVVKGNDSSKKNGMYVGFQDDNTVLSTTPYPQSGSKIMINLNELGALSVDSATKKLTITYTVSNTGIKPLTDVVVSDTKCNSVTKSTGDIDSDNILDAASMDPGQPHAPENWKFTCMTNEITQTTEGIATVTAKEGGNEVKNTAKWKATVTTREVASSPYHAITAVENSALGGFPAQNITKIAEESQVGKNGCTMDQKWCVDKYNTAGGNCIPKNEVCWGTSGKGEVECKSYYGKWCSSGAWCNTTEGSVCGDEKIGVCEKEGGYWDTGSLWTYCATRSYVFINDATKCEESRFKEAGRIWCPESNSCTNSGKICNYASTASDCATRTNAEWCPSGQYGECVQRGWCTRLSDTACKAANRTWCPYPDGGGKCAIIGRDCFGKIKP